MTTQSYIQYCDDSILFVYTINNDNNVLSDAKQIIYKNRLKNKGKNIFVGDKIKLVKLDKNKFEVEKKETQTDKQRISNLLFISKNYIQIRYEQYSSNRENFNKEYFDFIDFLNSDHSLLPHERECADNFQYVGKFVMSEPEHNLQKVKTILKSSPLFNEKSKTLFNEVYSNLDAYVDLSLVKDINSKECVSLIDRLFENMDKLEKSL